MPRIRKYIITGLIVWIPILATIWIVKFIVHFLDQSLALLPAAYQPDNLFGFQIPGLGIILSLFLVITVGVITSNYFGRRIVELSEKILHRIPLIRSIYSGVKQVITTVLNNQSLSFRKVSLIEYPRKGLWTIAFQTSNASRFNDHFGESMVTVFVPTTPNPTSGFLIVVPEKDVKDAHMKVDDALKMVISLGVMQQESKD